MQSTTWTFAFSFTFGQFFLGDARDILSGYLSLVAVVAEVSVSPAKPLGNSAAKFAFIGNILFPVLFAVSDLFWATRRTDKLLWVKFFAGCVHHSFCTTFATSEIRFIAFEALEIGINGHGVLFRVVVIWRSLIAKSEVFIIAFMNQSLERFLFYLIEELLQINKSFIQGRFSRKF